MRTQASQRALRFSAALWAGGFLIHGVDHLARGLSKTPVPVFIAGILGMALGGVAIVVLILRDHRLSDRLSAPAAIVIGSVTAASVVAVHVPAYWGAFSEPFRGQSDVTALDWASVASSFVGALAFAAVGVYVLIAKRSDAAAPPRAVASGN